MDYVVFETGGKQYRVKPGDVIEIDKIDSKNDSVTFDSILLSVDGEQVNIGKPFLSGVQVVAKVLSNEKGKKIRVARFTAKSRHRRVIGFRPSITRIQIENIGGKSAKAKSSKA